MFRSDVCLVSATASNDGCPERVGSEEWEKKVEVARERVLRRLV